MKLLKIFAVVLGGIIIIGGVFLLFWCGLIDTEMKITITSVVSGVIAIIGLYLFYQRLKKQDKQIALQQKQIVLQIEQRTDERFTTAVNLLGSNETSARTGAIYSLYHLALEEEKYRKEVAQILCSHVRSKTNEQEYQKNHKDRPSNEIQTTIDLLVRNKNGNTGIYCHDFAQNEKFPKANFAYAYLVKTIFRTAQCKGAIFTQAQCQEADFTEAQCQRANFMNAQCQGADFKLAQCQGANFFIAQCQGAIFIETQCQGADFKYAQCQGAHFDQAQCQEVSFTQAQCQGANFIEAQCQGADFKHGRMRRAVFSRAQCQGADFTEAQCQRAIFIETQCQGAKFYHSQCQEADFGQAQCQGADFSFAQCQGANFTDAQCQGADFKMAQCQDANFTGAQCQGADFHKAQCQGADFHKAQCQKAFFFRAQCQGAYTGESFQNFKDRIGKKTELENMLFSGKLDEKAIESIEAAKKYLSTDWHQKMQKIIEENKDKAADYTTPKDIITGILEDNEENQAIAERNWEKLKQIQENKKNSK